ncbi:MAG TPA: amidase family protein, partial [Thermoplasmata archaeon]|nr:amidase family protein [Thermoplasmata archaeon]
MDVDRRDFLVLGATAAAATAAAGLIGARGGTASQEPTLHALRAPAPQIEEATIAELQAAMAAGSLTARSLVRMYLARIQTLDRGGPHLNSILELNPDAESIAMALDAERRRGEVRGPLHGIPIVLKDNIDTADRMITAAGSLALVGT